MPTHSLKLRQNLRKACVAHSCHISSTLDRLTHTHTPFACSHRWLVLAEHLQLHSIKDLCLELARNQPPTEFTAALAGDKLDADLMLLSTGLLLKVIKAVSTPLPPPPLPQSIALAIQRARVAGQSTQLFGAASSLSDSAGPVELYQAV